LNCYGDLSWLIWHNLVDYVFRIRIADDGSANTQP